MSIPKIFHWGAFRGYQLSESDLRCHASWRAVMPGVPFHSWGDADVTHESFRHPDAKPINTFVWMKFWVLYNVGGYFLDNDVELLQPLPTEPGCLLGFQKTAEAYHSINTAVIAAAPGNAFIGECLRRCTALGGRHGFPPDLGCGVPTDVLFERGMRGVNVEQQVGDVRVYATDVFYPWLYGERPDRSRVNPRTLAIHHWSGSWL